jgi:hypothetical protein
MTPNHALHRTGHQRRYACWCPAGEGRRYALGDAVIRMLVVAFFLTISICGAIAQDHAILVDGEAFTKKSVGKPPGGDRLVEYIREDESFEKWTKLVGFRYQQLPRIQNDPTKLAPAMAKIVKASNPRAQTRVIVNREKGEAVVDFLTWPSDGSYMEFNVFRYVRSADGNGIVSLQLAHRFTDVSAEGAEKFKKLRESWVNQAVEFDMEIVHVEFKQ